jgi:surface protein
MVYMFSYAHSATNSFDQDISGWDVSSVTNMYQMFTYAGNFGTYTIAGWDVSSVTNMSFLFYECPDFNHNLSGWNVSNVTACPYFNASSGSQRGSGLQSSYKPNFTSCTCTDCV